MNDTQLLERLSSAYATVDAPAPSAALAAVLDAGAVRDTADEADGERRDAAVIPLARPQTRLRVRHLVAAMVATFVLFSGLAVAGALPDPVQRQVSSVVSQLGIDLPSPDPAPPSGAPAVPRPPVRQGPTATSIPAAGTATTLPAGAGDAPATTAPTTPATPSTTTPGLPLGDVGDLGDVGETSGGGTVTTLPPSGGSLLPPLNDPLLPPLSLPPITLGPITILPPINLPPLNLPIIGL
jgi:hypothetical protein